jgi:hypothetical protein
MKQLFWVIVGVALGFVAAHKINQTEQGREFFATVDAKTRDLTDAVVEGYKAREAELRASASK